MKLAALPALALALGPTLAACHIPADPVAVQPTNNPEVNVSLLFSADGCDVYRFYDGGEHYFARCQEGRVSTLSPKRCGKNCRRDEEVPTESVPNVRSGAP
jgi:hypothetical protein